MSRTLCNAQPCSGHERRPRAANRGNASLPPRPSCRPWPDSLVASFSTKYYYNFWRPETAIRAGDTDGNAKTDEDFTFAPFIVTPCFPSYPSNHGSGSNGAAEILRRLYGAGGHSVTLSTPAVPGVTLQYTTFKQICDDISDARIYGGIHFRFDQEAGARLGREVATHIYKHNLRGVNSPD